MKKFFAMMMVMAAAAAANAGVLLTGIIDGQSSNPKGIELYVDGTMDLTGYTVEIEANGGSDWYEGYTFSGTYSDQFIYITYNADTMTALFDSATSENTIVDSSFNQNGNDAIRLLDATSTVIDQLGDPSDITTGFAWNYVDSFAYRVSGTTANGTFTISDWYFGGADLLDSGNDPATEYFGTYQVPEPATISLIGAGVLAIARRRKA